MKKVQSVKCMITNISYLLLLVFLLMSNLTMSQKSSSFLDKLHFERDSNIVSELAVRKISEIKQCVLLDDWQFEELYVRCFNYQKSIDSALIHCDDAQRFGEIKFQKDSVFHYYFYSLMTDSQTVVYVRNKGKADVERKTDEKMKYLESANYYKEEELEIMRKQIFHYLMREKVVYMRDKYDIDKQKQNIQSLKMIQPICLKEAETRRKLKNKGLITNEGIVWRRTKYEQ